MTVNKINLHFAGKFSIDHNRIPGRKYETITIFLMQRQVNRMDSCDSHGRSTSIGREPENMQDDGHPSVLL